MKIAILDDFQRAVPTLECYKLLADHEVHVFTESMGEDALVEALRGFQAIVLIRERTTISAGLLSRLPDLKLISQTGKVSGHVDVDAATSRGVAIVEGVGDPTAPAELTWALIMAAYRRIPQYAQQMKAGRWQHSSDDAQYDRIGRTLKGDTLGIWGYGKIGRLIASYGKVFGMHVLVWGREPSRVQAVQDGYQAAETKEQFFSQADVLTLHLRLNDATKGIVGVADLALMKPTSLLVNTSRAELVGPGALQQALASGRPGYGAFDVFETEPASTEALGLQADNVIATPHLGYVEQKGYELYFGSAFRNVVDFFAGTPKNVLNPQSLSS
ncbi:D-2-hydroxyacid dehydrogenase family protein [Ottowia thiooxydans]|uniref:D-2-hydroxyacid dehydrogenase family protein n=1 Tax=Ottowia thiooxydans TaxID=219182 RepID=UPI00042925BE|nr:D-2-hydroxyacid dehydrogenase family protein [Ottowia thiooxydans]